MNLLKRTPRANTFGYLLVCLGLFFSPSSSAFAQISKDTLVAYQFKAEADSLFKEYQYQEALSAYGKAKTAYTHSEFWERVVKCTNLEARTYFRLHKYDRAHEKIQESLALIAEKIEGTIYAEGEAYDLLSFYYEIEKSDFKSAITYLKKAQQLFKSLPDSKGILARSYGNLAIVYFKIGQYEEGIGYLNQSLETCIEVYGPNDPSVSSAFNNLGIVYNRLGDYEAAAESFEEALRIDKHTFGENHMNVGNTYMGIAQSYHSMLNFKKATAYNDSALAIINGGPEDNKSLAAKIYTSNAITFNRMNQFEKSIEYAKKAMRVWDEVYGEYHLEADDALKILARSNSSIGEHDFAINYIEKALAANLQTLGEQHVWVGSAYGDLGDFYRAKGIAGKALENHSRSLKIYEAIYGKTHPEVAKLYGELAQDHALRGSDSLKLEYLERAQKVENELNERGNIKRIFGLIDLSNAYLDENQNSKARHYLSLAMEEVKEGKTMVVETPEENTAYSKAVMLFRLFTLDARWHLQHFKLNKQRGDLEKSLAGYRKMDSLVDQIAVNYEYQNDKIAFRESTQKAYQDAVEAHFLYSKYVPEAVERAFYFSEKNRFTTLRSLINESSIQEFSNIPQEVLQHDRELKTKRAYYLSKIAQLSEKENENEALKKYEDRLFEVNSKYDSLIRTMRSSFPNYSRLIHDYAVTDVESVKRAIQDNAILLQYLYSEETGYLFVISDDGITVKSLDVRNLDNILSEFVEAGVQGDLQKYKKNGFLLYKILIAPAKELLGSKELIISPYGQLWKLNFDLLMTKEVASNNPRELPYMLKQHPISYANSATLRFGNLQSKKDLLNECLAFSFSSDKDNIDFGQELSLSRLRDAEEDLPGTRREISEIAEIVDGVYYYGEEAKESNFKKHANKYSMLHLALHGEVNDKNPGNSRLFFTQSTDSLEDNHLFTHELYALSLPAELAVLSACNTGAGKLTSGEGIMSLGNAFQYAGTKSLLLSHWEVSDNSAPELMRYFYSNLKKGMTKSRALQQAKLSYLETAAPNRVHPFYWGSFYVLGDNAPVDLASSNYFGLIVLLIGLLLLGGLLFRKLEKPNKREV